MKNDFISKLEELEDLLDESWNLPLSNNKYIVNGEKLKGLVSDIKMSLPKEMQKAHIILKTKEKLLQNAKLEKDTLIKSAKRDSEMMIQKARQAAENIEIAAKNQARKILDEQEILRIAEARAEDIVNKAKKESVRMKKATREYIESVLIEPYNALKKATGSIEKIKNNYHDDNED